MSGELTLSLIVGGLTVLTSWFVSRNKSKTDSFKSLIEANESFRVEVKGDLDQSKKDLSAAREVVETLRGEVSSLREKLNTALVEIAKLGSEASNCHAEKEKLTTIIADKDREILLLKETISVFENREILLKQNSLHMDRELKSLRDEFPSPI